MALPSSGNPLSFNQIRTELGLSQSNSSLRSMSSNAGKSVPDAVSEFYGFSNGVGVAITATMNGYGSMSTEGYQNSQMEWALVAENYSYGYAEDTDNRTLDYGAQVQIDAYTSAYFNYINLEIYTNDEYIYSAEEYNYGTISTTQYKTFTTTNSPGGSNSLDVVSQGYYMYGY